MIKLNDSMVLPHEDKIAPMRKSDLYLVHQLECISQKNPWSLQSFADELTNSLSSVDLYWRKSDLAGYLCSWLIGKELQIQNLAVKPDYRRQGIAMQLINHVIKRSIISGLQAIVLEVRKNNTPAIELYQGLGFCPSGIRQGYYPDGEDALVMTYKHT